MCKIIIKLMVVVNLVMVTGANALADDTVRVSEGSYRKTISSRPIAGYFIIENLTDKKITLISASSEFADHVELHTHKMKDGVMSMIKLRSLEVEAKSSLQFKTGGSHLMIFGLDNTKLPDERLPVELQFSDGTTTSIWLKKLP